MTRDELLARYDLIEQVTSGSVETHHALHPSGAVVMVHFIHGSTAFQAHMADSAHRASEGGASAGKVLHVHMVEGHPVVVTRFLTDFVTLEHWFASLGIASGPAGGEGPRQGVFEAPKPPDSGLSGGGLPSQAPSDSIAPTEQLGEFTQMFSALPPPAAPPPGPGTPDQAATVQTPRPPAPEEPPSPPSPRAATPPAAPSPPPKPSPPADEGGPGEFTRLFRTPMGEDPAAPSPEQPQPPAPRDPTPPPPPGGGEFTRLFGSSAPGADPHRNPWTDPARRPPSEGSSQDVRKSGTTPERPGQGEGPAPPGPPRDASPTGPGEFTKFFKPPVQPTEPPPRSHPVEPPLFSGSGGASEAQRPPAAPGGGSWSEALRSSRSPGPGVPEPPPPAPPPDEGRGEFTQIFGRDAVLPSPPPTMPAPGKGAERSGSEAPPVPKSSPPIAPRVPAIPGGLRGVPRAPRLPGAESLLRNAGARAGVPVPRAPVPHSARQLGRMALGGIKAPGPASPASAAETGGGSPERGEAEPQRKGPSVAFAVGLTLVVVTSLVLVLFFALWNFDAPAPAEEPVAEPVTADSLG